MPEYVSATVFVTIIILLRGLACMSIQYDYLVDLMYIVFHQYILTTHLHDLTLLPAVAPLPVRYLV